MIFNSLSCCSGFKDLFDWQYFIEMLKDDIHIVETLPPDYDGTEPFTKTPISWSKVDAILLCFLLSSQQYLGLHLRSLALSDDVHSCQLLLITNPRFEKDMLAFTGCSHNLTAAEEDYELQTMQYEVSHWKEKAIDGPERRMQEDELKPFRNHQNMLAGLDYVVALIVTSFNHCWDSSILHEFNVYFNG
ncbi:hypothetical protein RHMOL_Rhmol05G0009200 [Rhododendron molle]|uniref:Uncharacterized protein n=1 Tax=Rhododendron molle TaxID=49168 RepID=A0ACC0NLI4_RHOML|nr:hypothetical protein RHMOL_Rhmol05G0009200 [Rhododendron molle]